VNWVSGEISAFPGAMSNTKWEWKKDVSFSDMHRRWRDHPQGCPAHSFARDGGCTRDRHRPAATCGCGCIEPESEFHWATMWSLPSGGIAHERPESASAAVSFGRRVTGAPWSIERGVAGVSRIREKPDASSFVRAAASNVAEESTSAMVVSGCHRHCAPAIKR
jgi:hypothetical protein